MASGGGGAALPIWYPLHLMKEERPDAWMVACFAYPVIARQYADADGIVHIKDAFRIAIAFLMAIAFRMAIARIAFAIGWSLENDICFATDSKIMLTTLRSTYHATT